MKTFLKFLAWPVAIVLFIGLYFSSNIRGYYRFKEICEKEAGLHVYQPLERNVGWTVRGNRIYNTEFPVLLKDVAFVRYEDTQNGKYGNFYDVYRVPKQKTGDPGYAQQPADQSKAVVYQYRVQMIDRIPNELRMGARHYEVINLKTGELAVRYSEFGYSKFNVDKTILAAPSGEGCPEDYAKTDPQTGKSIPSKMVLAFVSAFTK